MKCDVLVLSVIIYLLKKMTLDLPFTFGRYVSKIFFFKVRVIVDHVSGTPFFQTYRSVTVLSVILDLPIT